VNTDPGPVSPSVSRWSRFSAWLGRTWRALLALLSPPEPEPMTLAPVSTAPPPPPGLLRARRKLQTPC
jgi:hypothetical protein